MHRELAVHHRRRPDQTQTTLPHHRTCQLCCGGPLAASLAKEGDFAGAVAEFREAIRLEPDNDVAHLELAAVLAKKDVAEYRKAIRLKHDAASTHRRQADLLVKKGDRAGAI